MYSITRGDKAYNWEDAPWKEIIKKQKRARGLFPETVMTAL